jgi:uncharacterized FlaG/YvyC family protein
MELEIYKDFVLKGVLTTFVSLIWTRKFSVCGTFKLEIPFDLKKDLYKLEMLELGNVIYKRNTNEGAVIESHEIIQTSNGKLSFVINGRFLGSILDRRIFDLAGDLDINVLLTRIINENFLTAGNRKIDNLRLMPFSLPAKSIKADYKHQDALKAIETLMQQQQTGFRIDYNIDLKTYDLQFYDKKTTDVIFTPDFNNILQQDYLNSISKYKNVVYVGDIYVHNDTIQGLDRREKWTDKGEGDQNYNLQKALDALQESRAIKSLASEIDPNSPQFDYLIDYDLGSLVLSENRFLNYSENDLINEITEVYSSTGLRLEVNFGDYIPKK